GVEGSVRRLVQVAVKGRRLFCDREAAQYLAGMLPESSADLGKNDVAFSHRPAGGKLRRHRDLRIAHRRHAEIVDPVGGTMREVGTLDQIAELALRAPDLQSVAQASHAAIAEMRADA